MHCASGTLYRVGAEDHEISPINAFYARRKASMSHCIAHQVNGSLPFIIMQPLDDHHLHGTYLYLPVIAMSEDLGLLGCSIKSDFLFGTLDKSNFHLNEVCL